MTVLALHAVVVLLVAFIGSLLYELYRATLRAGVSRHDSMDAFVKQNLLVYVLAAIVVGLLIAQVDYASWVGLAFTIAAIVVSVLYYNPRIMPERRPGLIDWFEDLAFTGLLFVAATLLLYDVAGWTLQP